MLVRQRLDWFKEAILPHEAVLRSRLRRILPEGYDIDNLVAEAMTRAYAHGDIQQVASGRAYLFRIARNIMLDTVRREKIVSFELVADIDLLQADQSLEATLQARDELRHLEAMLDTLPPQCRRVFVARRIHQQSIGEIAEDMGLSISTVDKHLTRATLKITQAVGRYESFGWTLQKRAKRATQPAEGRVARP